MARHSGFVNRVEELSALAEAADRASRGESRVVHLTGPAGIGKTALIDAFLGEHAELVGVAVAGAEVEAGMHLGVAGALLQPDTPLGRLLAGPRGHRLGIGGLDATAVREMASRLSTQMLSAAEAGVLQAQAEIIEGITTRKDVRGG
jgi:predicted ATPase